MRLFLIFLILAFSCTQEKEVQKNNPDLFVAVLGIAQDAGSPQIGCEKECCRDLWGQPEARQKVISLGIVDRRNNKAWILDATPDFKDQLKDLLDYLPNGQIGSLDGIFLTHAHMGHYTGLMELGREAMGSKNVAVFAMPQMRQYLENNGPWSQLVTLQNIKLNKLKADSTIQLSDELTVTPFLVPHRDEYTETVGYKVSSATKSFLFIPDIDKWHKWERDIVKEVEQVDYAFLDGAFYSEKELPNRDMSEIPHPFVPETIKLFNDYSPKSKNKVIFIHLNHTNPLLKNDKEYTYIIEKGYRVGREGQIFALE